MAARRTEPDARWRTNPPEERRKHGRPTKPTRRADSGAALFLGPHLPRGGGGDRREEADPGGARAAGIPGGRPVSRSLVPPARANHPPPRARKPGRVVGPWAPGTTGRRLRRR